MKTGFFTRSFCTNQSFKFKENKHYCETYRYLDTRWPIWRRGSVPLTFLSPTASVTFVFEMCKNATRTTVLSLICVAALNATTGNSCCKHCIHFSKFSLGTRSATENQTTTTQSPDSPFFLQMITLDQKHAQHCLCFVVLCIHLFCLEPKAVSCCLPSAALTVPAVDTCNPADHERRVLLSLHQTHRWPEKVDREVRMRSTTWNFLQ